jgi:hypothetical protein
LIIRYPIMPVIILCLEAPFTDLCRANREMANW